MLPHTYLYLYLHLYQYLYLYPPYRAPNRIQGILLIAAILGFLGAVAWKSSSEAAAR